nr:hypothetical protein [Mycoplasmopsis bovis]
MYKHLVISYFLLSNYAPTTLFLRLSIPFQIATKIKASGKKIVKATTTK